MSHLNKRKFINQKTTLFLMLSQYCLLPMPFFRLPQTAVEQKKDAICFQTLAPMTVISW